MAVFNGSINSLGIYTHSSKPLHKWVSKAPSNACSFKDGNFDIFPSLFLRISNYLLSRKQ